MSSLAFSGSSAPTSHARIPTGAVLALCSIAALVLATVLAHWIDASWAHQLYAWQGGTWALRDHVLLEGVLHNGGRWVSALAWLVLLCVTLWHWRRAGSRNWTRPAVALLIAVLISTVLVSWLKSVTHVDCPWDLIEFGGQRPYIPLFASRPAALGTPSCFPAGHASGGYAWVALYFFFARVRPSWRWFGLAIGLFAGLVFGFAQQLRGAHFISHDVATLTVCWTVACSMEALRYRRLRSQLKEAGA